MTWKDARFPVFRTLLGPFSPRFWSLSKTRRETRLTVKMTVTRCLSVLFWQPKNISLRRSPPQVFTKICRRTNAWFRDDTTFSNVCPFFIFQKARLARIRIAKASSGAAFVSKKKAAEARLAAQESGLQLDDNYKEEDIFELQHHHLLRCLEKTTVRWTFLTFALV